MLLSPGNPPQPVTGADDPRVGATAGPAMVVSTEGSLPSETCPEGSLSVTDLDAISTLSARPLAYREAGRPWHVIGYEAADHWSALSPDLRKRLLTDRTAVLDVEDFKATTGGASASMITQSWVYSGRPRRYRIAGELRELTEVLAAIGSHQDRCRAHGCR
ncbi:hypothetical protein DFO66_10984 [Brevibacterium sanguinis]|uniref:Uncharacterized protein n=3 Tax=Brevibacteriaceae TaxID=85019 RepID=A0A366IFZ8_9MICO|nr:hypothetical protein DFO66_10984 [Brevibacterium sanguinis]RBP70312.1 hypothetical protein DFO65_10984 [Brevibacterium celere]